jgi:hypothetical protein
LRIASDWSLAETPPDSPSVLSPQSIPPPTSTLRQRGRVILPPPPLVLPTALPTPPRVVKSSQLQQTDDVEGTVFIRDTSTTMRLWSMVGGRRRWKTRYARLSSAGGTISFWSNLESMKNGDDVVEETIKLASHYRLSPLKIDTNPATDAEGGIGSDGRIFYRSLIEPADLLQISTSSENSDGAAVYNGGGTRIWRWGVIEAQDLGVWSAGLRAALSLVTSRDVVARANADTVAAAEGLNAARLLRDAVAVGGGGGGGGGGGSSSGIDLFCGAEGGASASGDPRNLTVSLDDGTLLPIRALTTSSLRTDASAADVCCSIALYLTLRADADYSLFLALPPAPAPMPPGQWQPSSLVGLSEYTRASLAVCVPDAMSVESLVRAARASGATVIFRRRFTNLSGDDQEREGEEGNGNDDPLSAPLMSPKTFECATARTSADPTQSSVEDTNDSALWSPRNSSRANHVGGSAALAEASTPRGLCIGDTTTWLAAPQSVRRASVAWNSLQPNANADSEIAAATGAAAAAHRLAFLTARSDLVAGRLAITLQEALGVAGLMLVAEYGRVQSSSSSSAGITSFTSSTSRRNVAPLVRGAGPQLPASWYRARLWSLLSPQAVGQAEAAEKATSAPATRAAHASRVLDALAERLRIAHSATSTVYDSFGATRALVSFAMAQPAFGSQFFVALCVRQAVSDQSDGHHSPSASRTPPWATLTPRGGKSEPIPVLVAVGASGILMRPSPPMSPDTFEATASSPRTMPARKALATALAALNYGRESSSTSTTTLPPHSTASTAASAWLRASIPSIEVWGHKRTEPAFTFRVREWGGLAEVELSSSGHMEIAAAMQGVVFRLMATREGQIARRSRQVGGGGGAQALSKEIGAVMDRARARAASLSNAPSESWVEVGDPATGGLLLWNSSTHDTIFSAGPWEAT